MIKFNLLNTRDQELFEESQLEQENTSENGEEENIENTPYSLVNQMDWINIDDI